MEKKMFPACDAYEVITTYSKKIAEDPKYVLAMAYTYAYLTHLKQILPVSLTELEVLTEKVLEIWNENHNLNIECMCQDLFKLAKECKDSAKIIKACTKNFFLYGLKNKKETKKHVK